MKRFSDSGLEGLKNLPRAGRSPEVSEERFAEIKRELSKNLAGSLPMFPVAPVTKIVLSSLSIIYTFH
ncbi:MAG: hypothetical protein WAK17_10010 [Candidatus Nitrosopolaris sp.]